jgi:hypothetical protein
MQLLFCCFTFYKLPKQRLHFFLIITIQTSHNPIISGASINLTSHDCDLPGTDTEFHEQTGSKVKGNTHTHSTVKSAYIFSLTLLREVPGMARHDVTFSYCGVPSWNHLTALSDFSFHLSNAYEAITFCPLLPHR